MEASNKIFLLGGKDLEMQSISSLLNRYHIRYYDNHLKWDNAVLSAYEAILPLYSDNPEYEIYGVELREDIKPPSNYIRIDHHNMLDYLPSSLEQVANLLSYRLNRLETLVAANDSKYIPGMEQLGATREEILFIRREDRKAQGVTEEDEQLAGYALTHHMQKVGNLTIVKSVTSAFSPISDALYPCEHLLIFTEEEWVYYGKAKDKLVEYFKDEISEGQIFYGGSTSGYIGLAKGSSDFSHINIMIEQIKTIINHE